MPKTRTILSRYEVDQDGQIIVDASVPTVQDLYSYFDRRAPYLKKDLEPDFAEFLADCVREIGRRDFLIRISLAEMPEEALMERVRQSVHRYFSYLRELEYRAIRSMFRRSSVLFAIGLVLLVAAIVLTRRYAGGSGVLAEVFVQGLTVAAWVSLWEAIAILFLEWVPHHRDAVIYSRIAGATVLFRRFREAAPR